VTEPEKEGRRIGAVVLPLVIVVALLVLVGVYLLAR
jgi:hypothetical protein